MATTQKTNIWIDGSQAGSTLTELKKKYAILNKEIKDLPRNSDEYKKKMQELNQASSALTDHRNKIKGVADAYKPASLNIKSLISQAMPVAGVLGVATMAIGGISSAVGSWYQNNKQLEKGLSSLQSLTGATAEDLKYYKTQAIDLGKTTTLSANEVVNAYKLIGSAKPELLKNKEALNDVTKSAITLAEAAEMDLDGSVKGLTGTLNQFELGAEHSERVINALAAGSKEGSADIASLSDSFDKSGAVIAGFNGSVEEGVGLLEVLAEKNIKGAEAGTQLRNVLLTMQGAEALPQKALDAMEKYGVDIQKVTNDQIPMNERLREMSKVSGDATAMMQIFGKENIVAGKAILGNVDKFEKYTEAVTGTNTALEQQRINNDNLDGDLKSLGSAWEAYTLKLSGAGGGMDSIRKGVKFLSKNLEEVIGWVSKIVVAFVTFKAITTAVRTAQLLMNADFRKSIFSFQDLGKTAEGAGSSVGKFGKALKSIGFTALIALFLEVAKGFYDIASGAAAARFEIERYNESLAFGSKFGTESVKRIQEGFEAQKVSLELKKAEGKITAKMYEDELRNLNALTDAKIKAEIQLANESKKAAKGRGDKAIVARENETLKELISLQKERSRGAVLNKIDVLNSNKEIEKSNKESSKAYTENLKKVQAELTKIIEDGEKMRSELDYNKRLAEFEDEQEKELFVLQNTLDEKYNAQIESAQKLAKQKGEVGLKAQEQLNLLEQLKEEESEYKKSEISKKYAKIAQDEKLKIDKETAAKELKQKATLEDAILDLKIAKAQIAQQAVLKGDISGARQAANNLQALLDERLAKETEAKKAALQLQYMNDEISQEEFDLRIQQADLEHKAILEQQHRDHSEKKKAMDMEVAQNMFDMISQGANIIAQFQEAKFNKEIGEIQEKKNANIAALDEQLKSGEISEDEYRKRKEAVENEALLKENRIKNEQAKKEKQMALFQAGLATALAVLKAAPNPIAMAFAALTGVAQLAVIASKPVPQYADGGYHDVVGAKDNKRYRAKHLGRHKGGMLPNYPVTLASERGSEYYVPNHLLRDPRTVSHVQAIEAIRTNQFAEGGYNGPAMNTGGNDALTLAIKENTATNRALLQYLPNMRIVFGDGDIENLETRQADLDSRKN